MAKGKKRRTRRNVTVAVVYIKATSVASGLDGGRAILAVIAPFLAITVLGFLLAILAFLWLAIIF